MAKKPKRDATQGLQLAKDCQTAGWFLMLVDERKPPPSKQPNTWRAVAYNNVDDRMPWVQEWGTTSAEAVLKLEQRLRRWWILDDGGPGVRSVEGSPDAAKPVPDKPGVETHRDQPV